MRRFRIPEIALGALIGIILSLFAASIGSYQTEQCEKTNRAETKSPDSHAEVSSRSGEKKTGGDYQVGEHAKLPPFFACGASGLLKSAVGFMDSHEGFFVGGFTFALVIATILLWLSTERLWKAGKEALEATERAFVFLDGFTPELTTGADLEGEHVDGIPEHYRFDPGLYISRFAVLPRWKNGGNTPTRKMTFQVNWRTPPIDIPPDYVYRRPAEPFFLAPKAAEASSVVDMPGVSILVDWSFRPTGEEPLVLIWGRADYEDVFGRSHFVEWCYRLRFERHDRKAMRAHFIQWGDHNRSDDG